jgi:hypothetical protein
VALLGTARREAGGPAVLGAGCDQVADLLEKVGPHGREAVVVAECVAGGQLLDDGQARQPER